MTGKSEHMEIYSKNMAYELIRGAAGSGYVFGNGCFKELGGLAATLGSRCSVVTSGIGRPWGRPIHDATIKSLSMSGLLPAGELIQGSAANAPMEDVLRISQSIGAQNPDFVVAVGGGSLIDAVKMAVSHLALSDRYPDLGDYFGTNAISVMLGKTGRSLLPVIAVQLASGSAAHLTKYSNVTDMQTLQKFIAIDTSLVPQKALFDYELTCSMSRDFTMDGALDGISHCLEVYMGYPQDKIKDVEEICLTGIRLIVDKLKRVLDAPDDTSAREALGLGTDLGGCAIMIGGTSGAHLNSFSLVDILPHGRACALMNPYYVVYFSPVIEVKIRKIGEIYRESGFLRKDISKLSGMELGEAVAGAMIALSKEIGFPTTLSEVPMFTEEHIAKCIMSAKNPKFESKLKNMPIPMDAGMIDRHMGSVLNAAMNGDMKTIESEIGEY